MPSCCVIGLEMWSNINGGEVKVLLHLNIYETDYALENNDNVKDVLHVCTETSQVDVHWEQRKPMGQLVELCGCKNKFASFWSNAF